MNESLATLSGPTIMILPHEDLRSNLIYSIDMFASGDRSRSLTASGACC